jgi:hypothetical protein
MRLITLLALAFALALPLAAQEPAARAGEPALDPEVAGRLANLALSCVHREYPNKIAHVMHSDRDARPPRELTPSFYGCFDWHSAVHGHWLLARLARLQPDAPHAAPAKAALAKNITTARIAREVAYMEGEGRASFERPYGLAWLLQLGAELREWDTPEGRALARTIEPLEKAAARRLSTWLPKLTHPVRSGEHSQSAFALGLMLDWARTAGESEFEALVESKIRSFYLADASCPISYEPSGEDFLSPCLAEADAVRRVLTQREFAAWLGRFLPQVPFDGSAEWLEPLVSPDPTDGKLAHLDGLDLSRAWMLDGIASALPEGDPRIASLRAAADAHAAQGLIAVSGEHYEGGHWLGSFATYAVTRRGITR